MFFIIFISGNGSNLQEVIDYCEKKNTNQLLKVICNKQNVKGIERCKKHNIPYQIFEFKKSNNYKTKSKLDKQIERDNYENEILQDLIKINNEFTDHKCILCLGWMHILGKKFLDELNKIQFSKHNSNYKSYKIFNLHPSLPFDNKLIGTNAIDRAWAQYLNCERVVSGVMIHELIDRVDEGNYFNVEVINLTQCIGISDFKMKMFHLEKNVVNTFLYMIINNISIVFK